MDIFLVVLGSLLCILALIGSILPILPGPLLAYIALILLQLTSAHPFTWTFFIVWGVIVILLNVLDYIIPSRWTKKFGGSKRGVRGSNIGLVVSLIILPLLGIVIGPFGILWLIACPFLWAYLGERYGAQQEHHHALRSAWWSFVGFLAGSFLKLVVTCVIVGYFFVYVYKLFIA